MFLYLELRLTDHLTCQVMKINRAISRILFAMLFLYMLLNCKKQAILPTVLTNTITNVGAAFAILGGEVISDGGSAILEKGICLNTNENPTLADIHYSVGPGTGSFSLKVTLHPFTTYFIKAYATSLVGTAYGDQIVITTIATSLTVTATIIARGDANALIEVNVVSDGSSPVTARGICWGTRISPTIVDNKTTDGAGAGKFTSSITGLDPGTVYYFRAYATNSDSTFYATAFSLVDSSDYPIVYSQVVSALTPTTAVILGSFDTDLQHIVSNSGVCWGTSPNPTIADNHSSEVALDDGNHFICRLADLTPNTTYFLRTYAISNTNPHYGNEFSFVAEQLSGPGISDIDDNLYHTVTIGNQTWMAENLKTTRYRNGDPIPNVTEANAWMNQTSGAWCNYDNSDVSKLFDFSTFHGKLYNWFAVNDARNIAPAGWHLPNEAEWTTLINYLKNNVSERVSKSMAAKSDWGYSGSGIMDLATNNSSGFTALPAGYRVYHFLNPDGITIGNNGSFMSIWNQANWWTSSESNGIGSFVRLSLSPELYYPTPDIIKSKYKMDGYSVRCVKD